MLYIKVDADHTMTFFCKNCAYEKTVDDTESVCVAESHVTIEDDSRFSMFTTPLIKYDPTLPHVTNILCPNTSCSKRENHPDVIYIKCDPINMKYLYFCCNCETFWKNNSKDSKN